MFLPSEKKTMFKFSFPLKKEKEMDRFISENVLSDIFSIFSEPGTSIQVRSRVGEKEWKILRVNLEVFA